MQKFPIDDFDNLFSKSSFNMKLGWLIHQSQQAKGLSADVLRNFLQQNGYKLTIYTTSSKQMILNHHYPKSITFTKNRQQ
jgi:hypothetical protein